MSQEFLRQHFCEISQIAQTLDLETIDRMVKRLVLLRKEGGRLFLIGVGGSAANASHAVSDFRKLTGIEAYSPVDNVSELTARTNDEGWETIFSEWLKGSYAQGKDVLFVFSVGGGSLAPRISANLISAIEEAKKRGMDVLGIVGRDGGFTKQKGDIVLVIPTVNSRSVTPHAEAFQAVVWHALVSDPRLMLTGNKWETILIDTVKPRQSKTRKGVNLWDNP